MCQTKVRGRVTDNLMVEKDTCSQTVALHKDKTGLLLRIYCIVLYTIILYCCGCYPSTHLLCLSRDHRSADLAFIPALPGYYPACAACMCVEKTLGRIEDHVRRCDQGLMLILAFGKNGTVGVIRSWGAIRAVHMTACLCVSPPLPSPLKTMPATARHSLSLFYFSSQAVFMPLSSSQPLLFLIFICFSVKECKDFFFFHFIYGKKRSPQPCWQL